MVGNNPALRTGVQKPARVPHYIFQSPQSLFAAFRRSIPSSEIRPFEVSFLRDKFEEAVVDVVINKPGKNRVFHRLRQFEGSFMRLHGLCFWEVDHDLEQMLNTWTGFTPVEPVNGSQAGSTASAPICYPGNSQLVQVNGNDLQLGDLRLIPLPEKWLSRFDSYNDTCLQFADDGVFVRLQENPRRNGDEFWYAVANQRAINLGVGPAYVPGEILIPGRNQAIENRPAPVPEQQQTGKGINILFDTSYAGPNLYAHSPIFRMTIDLGELEYWPTRRLGADFIDRLLELIPGLEQHGCSYGSPGGFVRRMWEDEGTWLGHVLEHVAIELQKMAGWDVGFGKTRSNGQPGQYDVVYESYDKEVGLEAGYLARDIIEHFLPEELQPVESKQDEDADIREKLEDFIDYAGGRTLGPSTAALVKAAEERGIPWFRLSHDSSLMQFGYGRHQKRIKATMTSHTSQIAVDLAQDKEETNRLLRDLDLPVPAQQVVSRACRAVRAAEQIGYPVVVKPLDANHGQGVSMNLHTPEEVELAFDRAREYCRDVLVESEIRGFDHRMLVVDGKLIAVAKRVPGHVIGDGRRTIEELVKRVNRDPRRGIGHDKPLTRLALDENAIELLALKGFKTDSVPADGEVVYLRKIGNLSTGGTAIDVTDEVHPDNREMAIRAIKAIGLDVGGVDFITQDISRSYQEIGGAICEVNAGPGFRMHLAPSEGKPRDVAGPVLDMLFPRGTPRSIPMAAITGSNGKTTTSRMLAHITRQAYDCVGLATTDAVYIDGKSPIEGDMTGPAAARMILRDPDVDAAVLETARGGILRRGLAYDSCNVSACLNVTGDHLGIGGIDTLEQLADLKRIVIEVADDMAVLNADDQLCLQMADFSRASDLCYVTLDPNHSLVREHIRSSGTAVMLEPEGDDQLIVFYDRGHPVPVMTAREIPATLGGRAMHNVQNAMFAIAMAFGMRIELDEIRRGLTTFEASFSTNPGRMNLYEGHPFKVILDYGHNPHAVGIMCDLVERMPVDGKRIAVLTAPGDRRDEDIHEIAQIAARHFDEFICHRDDDSRGRGDWEVPKMLERSLREAGVPQHKIRLMRGEAESNRQALLMAEPGDLILILAEKCEKSWNQIVDFKPDFPDWDCSRSERELLAASSPRQSRVIDFEFDGYHGMDLIRDERGVRLARPCED